MRRLLITGGGTGGHIYPGIAVAEAARARFPDLEIRFIGGRRLEARILPESGWPFDVVPALPLPRRAGPGAVRAVALNLWGTVRALAYFRRWRPDAVLATGGYVAGPVGLAAWLLRIPLVLQEQNLVPGLTNRLLARWARAVSIPHPSTGGFPPRGVVVTGVPVRASALQGDRLRGRSDAGLDPDRPTLLVLGGSQGALSLNRAVTEAGMLLMYEPWQILHQTGSEHLAWVRKEIGRREHVGPGSLRHVAVPYIDRIGDAYAAADLVLCRAGASTLAEVTARGKPALLVPYPHAIAREQDANARILAEAGAAELIADAELTGGVLADRVGALLRDPARLRMMGEASARMGHPEAALRVLDLLVAAAEGRTRRPHEDARPTGSSATGTGAPAGPGARIRP